MLKKYRMQAIMCLMLTGFMIPVVSFAISPGEPTVTLSAARAAEVSVDLEQINVVDSDEAMSELVQSDSEDATVVEEEAASAQERAEDIADQPDVPETNTSDTATATSNPSAQSETVATSQPTKAASTSAASSKDQPVVQRTVSVPKTVSTTTASSKKTTSTPKSVTVKKSESAKSTATVSTPKATAVPTAAKSTGTSSGNSGQDSNTVHITASVKVLSCKYDPDKQSVSTTVSMTNNSGVKVAVYLQLGNNSPFLYMHTSEKSQTRSIIKTGFSTPPTCKAWVQQG